MRRTQTIIAGHGGQGVLELANYICYLELLNGRHVAYTPSYGPESRGGKVKCYVVASEQEIDSPIVEEPDYLIVMNIPSMDYLPLLKEGGTLLMNSSLIPEEPARKNITTFKIPATEIADSLRNQGFEDLQDTKIVANSVMLGAYLGTTVGRMDENSVEAVFRHFLTDRKVIYIPLNLEAVHRGFEFLKKLLVVPELR